MNKNRVYTVAMIALIGFFSSGCVASAFNIGENEGYCEDAGCDYSDAGVCGDPYNILKNKEAAKKLAYDRIECSCNHNKQLEKR
jgi:hypothetical protein